MLQWRSSMMDGCGVKITKQAGSTTYLAEEGEFVNDEWVSFCRGLLLIVGAAMRLHAGSQAGLCLAQATAACAASRACAQSARSIAGPCPPCPQVLPALGLRTASALPMPSCPS